MTETLLSFSEVLLFGRVLEDFSYDKTKLPKRGKGKNKHLEDQLVLTDPKFARIYGFSFEGTYYELPEPAIFLVDGDGESATDDVELHADQNLPYNLAQQVGGNSGNYDPKKDTTRQSARAPLDPSKTGVASADYQISNDIKFWPYDKADHTIRLDVTTGMIEQVLLDIYFGFDSPAISGAKVSGAKVSGAKVSGAKVSGAKVSGAKVSGAKVRGGD